MENKKKFYLIILAIVVAVIIALVLFYRYCPVGVSLSITFSALVSFAAGLAVGWFVRKRVYEGKR